MIRQQSVQWMTLVLTLLVGTHVMGQDERAAELYGRGLHAYFNGDYDSAVRLLSASIEKFGSDPRAYYFRGLALASQSGLEAGLPDLVRGADVEVNQADRPVYDINGALQRVQGPLRLELEKARSATRQAAAERKQKRDRIRYEELKRREDIVLLNPKRPIPQAKLDLPAVDLRGGEDPFASGMAFTGGKQVDAAPPTPVEPATAAPGGGAEVRDPLAAPGAAAPAQSDDPFATPARKTEPALTPQAAAPKTEANPFGEDMPKLELEGLDRAPGRAARIGGNLINVLGRTLSGQASDRDPFAEPGKKEAAPDREPAGHVPVPGGEPEREADATPPAAQPLDEAVPQEDAAKKPADTDDDPFN